MANKLTLAFKSKYSLEKVTYNKLSNTLVKLSLSLAQQMLGYKNYCFYTIAVVTTQSF